MTTTEHDRTPPLIVSAAGRSLAAGARQWGGLAAIVIAAVAGDQVTKYLVTSNLALYDSARVIGPVRITHLQNSGIAFGFFPTATAGVTALTAIALVWMLWFFARASNSMWAPDRWEHLQPVRPGLARSCHRLSRPWLVAGVQSRRLVHRARS